ncbi:hypothetical protein [Cryptosporangium arvum]|uniref:Uncharacterized protein n=1 Tax=Cryptosporangium arvum DSM 44712 TaxID=927661 RepID=A0A011AGG1_9ACTN|nr:hypothetical protein [Cryptosporangium arvum]EXG81106.1 hypothetical protein CryarDRAFT_2202 [Cryptosporangium arvum DSM 44712]
MSVPAPRRWAVLAAYAVPLCVLPSAIWRLSLTVTDGQFHWYPTFLSALSLTLALLTLGLVHDRGLRFPDWVPGKAGRAIPSRPVVATALIGGSILVALCVYLALNHALHVVDRGWVGIGRDEPVHAPPGWSVLRYYAPLVAWGPLVIAVALDYHRRTGRTKTAVDDAGGTASAAVG